MSVKISSTSICRKNKNLMDTDCNNKLRDKRSMDFISRY